MVTRKDLTNIDQKSNETTISIANRSFDLADSEWIRDVVYNSSDVYDGRNEANTQTTKPKQHKGVEVERTPENNTHLPYRKNDNLCESGEQCTIVIIGVQ